MDSYHHDKRTEIYDTIQLKWIVHKTHAVWNIPKSLAIGKSRLKGYREMDLECEHAK